MSIAENIIKIKTEIATINKRTQLVAVSKMHSADAVREALAAGQRLFGENRVQEAQEKFPVLQAEFPDLQLHLIGPLQTNKVKEALALFDVIQTVDREKLAVKLSSYMVEQLNSEKSQPLNRLTAQLKTKEFYVQVNTGEEPQKAGIAPQNAVEFVQFCRNDLQLNIIGLMCIPPVSEPAFMHFGLLRNLVKQLSSSTVQPLNRSTAELKLSMGMSADYLEAAEMGADFVRIGSAIFGARI